MRAAVTTQPAREQRPRRNSSGRWRAHSFRAASSSHKPGASIVLTAVAQIDVSMLLFRKDDGSNRSDLKLAMGLFDPNGNLVKDSWKNIALSGDDEAIASVRRAGVEVKVDFDVTPGRYMMRLLVQDTAGQPMGTKSASREIRPY